MDNEKADDERTKDTDDRVQEQGNAPPPDVNEPADTPIQNISPPDQQPTNQYFVSYSRTEYYFTREFVEKLKKNGLNVWFDQQQLLPGLEWKSEIDSGLENCAGLILVVSLASLRSPNVAYEWQSAIRQNKPIYLVLSEAVDIGKIELKSDDIDVTQYSMVDLVRYAHKIIDLRRSFEKRTSLLVKHILEDKEIQGRSTIPKPGYFGLQWNAPINVLVVGLIFALVAFSHIYLGALSIGPYSSRPGALSGMTGIFSFALAFVILRQLKKFLARQEFSVLQMRFLLLLSFVASLIIVFSLDVLDWSLLTAGALFILLGFFAFHELTFLKGSLLRWLKRYPVENTILDQPDVEKRVGGILLPNIIPGLTLVGFVINAVFWVWYRITEPPLRLTKTDQKKVPPTYDMLCVQADSILAAKVEKALKRYRMKRAANTASDMTIVIITNRSSEAFLEEVLATKNRLVIVLATSIVSNSTFEALQKLQWFDYRNHKDVELYDLARTLFSQDYSYLRGLPPSVGTIILPNAVNRFVTFMHLMGGLFIVAGGNMIVGVLKFLLTSNLTLPVLLLMILLGGLTVWSGWRIILETVNILNRRVSRNRQGARLSVILLPALAAAVVLASGPSIVISQVTQDFSSLVVILLLFAIAITFLVVVLNIVVVPITWFPAQTLAKSDPSGILFSLGDVRKKWGFLMYVWAIFGILLGITTLSSA